MRTALRLVLLALFALLATGCSGSRAAGAADVELSYAVSGPAPTAGLGQDLRSLVLRRLGAAQIGADVTQFPSEPGAIDEGALLRVVVDEALAPIVDELLTWRGTLLVQDPDPTYTPAPPDSAPLTPRQTTLASGAVERYWEGSHAAVMRAIEQWNVDASHRIVAEAEWQTEDDGGEPVWRTRAVRAVPAGELGEGVLVGRGDGGTLRLRAEPGTLASWVLADAMKRPLPPVLVRGRTSLGAPALSADAAVLSFGSGIRSYARAQEERLLLTTPTLPALRRVGAVGLPPNRWLEAACYLVPILLSLAWLAFVRRFDRAHPEPLWLVFVTFLLGAASTVLAGVVELLLARASPWLDPNVVTFGGQLYALPLAFAVLTVVVGLVEEGSKLLGAGFAVRRREFDEPVDGIVYGIASSLGFAAAENFHYFAMTRLTAPTVIARCFMSVPAHMFFGALWGYALGARLVEPRSRLLAFLALAAAAHGLFDALLSTDGGAMLAVLLNVGLASVFVVLVRRSLRHGVVDDAVRAIRPEERLLFRVGRPGLFALSSVALHLLAFAVFVLGAWYQLERHRPSVFVAGSSATLLLLGIAAFGISATVPLDVAVDDYGVTFAGAARPWRRIRGYTAGETHVLLDSEPSPIRLGPATPAVLAQITRALDEHTGPRPTDARTTTLESA